MLGAASARKPAAALPCCLCITLRYHREPCRPLPATDLRRTTLLPLLVASCSMQASLSYSTPRCARLQLTARPAAACRHTAAAGRPHRSLRRQVRAHLVQGLEPGRPLLLPLLHGLGTCRACETPMPSLLQASAAGDPPADPSAGGSSSGGPPPPPPMGSDAAATGSMSSVDITTRAVSLPFGVPTAGAVFFMAGFLKILIMCFPYSGKQ